MAVRYITFEVGLPDSVSQMLEHIQVELQNHGNSTTGWVIDVNGQRRTLTVEALLPCILQPPIDNRIDNSPGIS